jgi:hypothetical protein
VVGLPKVGCLRAGVALAVLLSRPFRPQVGWGAIDPGHRPAASALGSALPARWAGHCNARDPRGGAPRCRS